MGQRRIAYTSGESLLLTVDRGSVIAYASLDGGVKWTFGVPDGSSIVGVVYASTSALPSDVAAGPWRSLSSASTAVALDSKGTLHALDAVLGRELGTLPHEGEPLTLAAGGDALAVAFRDRVLLYRGGAKQEIARKGSALGFSRDGLTLAIGTAKGEVFFVDLTTQAVTAFTPTPGGHITEIVARPGGGWLVSSEHGLAALHERRNEKQLNGAVVGAVVDESGKRLAVQRSEANVVLYDWPPTVPTGRVNVTGGTIRDLAFGPDDKLGLALAGGGAAMVDPATFDVRRGQGRPEDARPTWLVSAESEQARKERTEEQSRRAQAHEPKSGLGARLGVGGMISLAIVVVRIFLIGAKATTPSYTYTPPSLGKLGDFGTCTEACERLRIAMVMEECQRSPESDCLGEATAALDAFKHGDCAATRERLDGIATTNIHAEAGPNSVLNAHVVSAQQGLTFACATMLVDPSPPEFLLKRYEGEWHEPEQDEDVHFSAPTPGQARRHALWSSNDGVLFVGELHDGNQCNVTRLARWGEPPAVDLANAPCSALSFFGRSAREVYVNLGTSVRRFDGRVWSDPIAMTEPVGSLAGLPTPGGDVFALTEYGAPKHKLFQLSARSFREAKLWNEDDAVVEVFAGSTAVWAYAGMAESDERLYRLSGKTWTHRRVDGSLHARSFRSLWQSPKGEIFLAKGLQVSRSRDGGASWEDFDLPEPAEHVWGRSESDVYVAGAGGLQHFDGTKWSAIGPSQTIVALGGDARNVYLIAPRIP